MTGRSVRSIWLGATLALAALVTQSVSALAGPYVVVNTRTGAVIDSSDANKPWFPASLTKLMTAYVTFEAIKSGKLTLNSPVRVSKRALAEPPSKMGFKVGTVMTVDNALKMVIVKSANDIAVALGETVSGSHDAFVRDMNRAAKALGMTRTRFANPNGLPDQRMRTTARDMALLGVAIRRNYPNHAHYFRIPAIRAGKRVLRSHNKLLEHFRGTNGMKTGFICASGFNIVASARRGNTELMAVVLGSLTAKDRAEMTANLLYHGFKGRGLDNKRTATSSLARLSPGFSAGPAPVNMRQEVCNRKRKPKPSAKKQGNGDSVAGTTLVATQVSYLGPRVRIMKPVRVRTGLPAGQTTTRKAPRRVPVPLPRPHGAIPAAAKSPAPQASSQTSSQASGQVTPRVPLPKRRPAAG
ncbi:D-alanyl-D-alanine carboxypeptidase family protein [Coralliovum pocilloporae]|uniref:D-alanyl-D-alanine carboxypeptidase family protein n=1 Tax=Coralliovum pocilloporae TaxID=3066369 RepID=UPI003306CA28